MTTKTKNAYALMWITKDYEGDVSVNTLVYRPPSGPEVRTYYEGHLDSRAGDEEEFARIESYDEAVAYFRKTMGQGGFPEGSRPGESKKALVNVKAAKKLYGYHETFAEPV